MLCQQRTMSYNYEPIQRASHRIAEALSGQLLTSIHVHLVDGEANVVYLISNRNGFVIDGAADGEILRIARLDASIEELRQSDMNIVDCRPFGIFLQHQVREIREIGLPWKGHGWEISFEGLFGKTMIVQSIYGAPKPEGFENCLRLGVAEYQWDFA